MSNIGCKTGSNVFYKARLEASKSNNRLSSREGAAEEMNLDRGRLFRIETGSTVPYPEEIAMMAELYNKPELENMYCKKYCPLGHDIPEVCGDSIDRITVEAVNTFNRIEDVSKAMIGIAVSRNQIDSDQIKEVFEVLDEICKITGELKLWVRKNLR